MARDTSPDRAVELTELVVGVPGVRGIYPQSVIAAVVAGLVRSEHSAATGLLQIKHDPARTRITARLAVDSTARAEDVITAVHAVLKSALPAEDIDLDVEIAHID